MFERELVSGPSALRPRTSKFRLSDRGTRIRDALALNGPPSPGSLDDDHRLPNAKLWGIGNALFGPAYDLLGANSSALHDVWPVQYLPRRRILYRESHNLGGAIRKDQFRCHDFWANFGIIGYGGFVHGPIYTVSSFGGIIYGDIYGGRPWSGTGRLLKKKNASTVASLAAELTEL
ncbi:hypothetical protein HJFPF1_12326 [Paramyrothecium foliicola]|nr:hypothetical protein HJFPF1_12326 [Paramyrothecium foliicola]